MKDVDFNGLKNLIRFYKGLENVPTNELYNIKDTVFLNDLTDEDRWVIVPKVEKYWRKIGFPYPEVNINDITDEYDKLLDFNPDRIWSNETKELTQHNLGLSSANCFHPHKYSVKCRDYRAPNTTFNDEEKFRKVIYKEMRYSGNPFKRTSLRNMISLSSGTHGVSNFRPTVAKYIYTKYCPMGGNVLDPSLGYSGRLFAALTSHISHYEGCDPCIDTYNGGLKMLETITHIDNKRNKLSCFIDDGERKNRLPNVVLHNIPFEEYKGKDDFFDLVFTSPPYFDTERYSNEDNQSWKKFPKYDMWVEGFLKPLITISHRSLKKGGYLILNIYGKHKGGCLEESTIDIAKDVFGHGLTDTFYMQMSKLMGIKNSGKIENRNDRYEHKIEPFLVFQK